MVVVVDVDVDDASDVTVRGRVVVPGIPSRQTGEVRAVRNERSTSCNLFFLRTTC